MGSRILPHAADELRQAIQEAGGNEVFAIGDTDGRCVTAVTITCRGQSDRVVALLDRPRPGQVVIHNHPSSDLTPSDADMQLAHLYGEKGVGVVIVDNQVTSANWVVEPHVVKIDPVDLGRVREVFEVAIPRALDGFEPRPQQIEMALAVATCLNGGRPLVVEAGTGTGKSLAYLVPAALWALQNDQKVVISTYTRTLQNQLMTSDVPVVARAGVKVRVQLLQGRNNYLCRRRLGLARAEAEDEADVGLASVLDGIAGWSDTTTDGSRLDLPGDVDAVTWERILSDSNMTLGSRCSEFGSCHWYGALRNAAAAHVVIVNHALLLADLSLRADIGRGILPKFDRLVLDEAHHLEDAATGASSNRFTAEAVRRAVAPLHDRGKRRGALGRIARDHLRAGSQLSMQSQDELEKLLLEAEGRTHEALRSTEDALQSLATLVPESGEAVRVDDAFAQSTDWNDWITPTLRNLAAELEATAEQLEDILGLLGDTGLSEAQQEPRMDVVRARSRLQAHVDILRTFLAPPPAQARWFAPASRRERDSAVVATAPVEVDQTLRRILWSQMGSVVATSATLAVRDSFQHWRARTGAPSCDEAQFPSPFDHFHQAVLGLPRDIAEPNTPAYLGETADAIVRAVKIADGGAFVLCTSYAAVQHYAKALRREPGRIVLAQGEGERSQILSKFLRNPQAVLVGTDSFWEGVSVKGQGLRLVILPRIPFRVPSDPLQEARREHLEARGIDPFRAYELPEAVLKLRQGYGRLIRSHSDRGVVLLLDTRVHSRSYGRTILSALPPARRVKGPTSWVESEITTFFRMISPSTPEP
ncbi:MAG: hypothetical protein H6737_24845 [Alphaproteobacteria bacterium]|nr:hypothetical protein [Alphaproteobacteria bacterium]